MSKRAVVALAQVAGADLDDPVREAERGDRGLGPADHLLEQGRRLVGRGVGEDLDLVELVDAQHAPGVAARRAGLAPVARRVGHEAHGAARPRRGSRRECDRRERHLGGGDAPQVVALDGVGVVGELGELAGGGERRGADEARRADLLERVGVAVERELAQRPRPGWRRCLRCIDEHRPGDLHGPLVVEDAERRADLPVRAPAGAAGTTSGSKPTTRDDRVVGVAGTVGRVGVRAGSGCAAAARGSPRRPRPRRRPGPARCSPSARLSACWPRRPRRRRAVRQPADLLRQRLDPVAQLVALGGQLAAGGRRGRGPGRRRPRRSRGGPSAAFTSSGRCGCGGRRASAGTVAAPRSRHLARFPGDFRGSAGGQLASAPMPAIEVDDLVVRYGTLTAVDRASFHGRGRRGARPARPQRCGQDLHGRDARGLPPSARPGRCGCSASIPSADRTRLAPRIGVMLQEGGVYPGIRPLEVLRLYAAFYDDPDDPEALLDRVGLTHRRTSTWRQLSGGEQQRLVAGPGADRQARGGVPRRAHRRHRRDRPPAHPPARRASCATAACACC